MSEARKAALADPAVRARMSEASKAALADPAVRARMSEARKAAWADPAVRARMSEARKAAWAKKARWECPDQHQKYFDKLRRNGFSTAAARAEIDRLMREAA